MTREESLVANFQALGLPADAIAWLLDVWHLTQVFDDVADGDSVTRSDLDRAVWQAMVTMPTNPFFTQNAVSLQSGLALSVLKWQASDAAERAGRADERSFVWRAAFYDLVLLVVLLIHGYSRAVELAPQVMALYGEKFAAYRKEFPRG